MSHNSPIHNSGLEYVIKWDINTKCGGENKDLKSFVLIQLRYNKSILYVHPGWSRWTSSSWNDCMRKSTSSPWSPKQTRSLRRKASSSRNRSEVSQLPTSAWRTHPRVLLHEERRGTVWKIPCRLNLDMMSFAKKLLKVFSRSRSCGK